MEIIKRLILNRTPKDMPYGSISCAKNMMVDDTGSFLTNDIGFKEAFNVFHDEEVDVPEHTEYIVGAIPCNEEIVIFTYDPNNKKSYIYRKPDGVCITYDNMDQYRVDTFWTWHGGKITGTYTYNYKGELIIAVGEYDCDNYVKVPLKSWNLNTGNSFQTYNVEEDIPAYDSSYTINTNGSLVCGVYTFFVRFKIDEYNYTKWFQITGDINIIQEAQSKKYSHQYLNASDELVDPINLSSFEVNSNGISNKNIVVNIKFTGSQFDKFQLGYIIKRNSDISGRLQGEYTVSQTEQSIPVLNNSFIEELSVDDILENPHQFFDVKNVINYNNRLYIANYEEHPVEDLSNFAINNTTINVENSTTVAFSRGDTDNRVWTITLDLSQTIDDRFRKKTQTNKGLTISGILTDSNGYVIGESKDDLINFISQYLVILIPYWIGIKWSSEESYNLFWFIQKANDNSRNGAICLTKKVNSSPETKDWNWDFDKHDYTIQIVGENKDNLDIIITYNNNSWSLLRKNNERSCVLGYVYGDRDYYYFGNWYSYDSFELPIIQPGNNIPDNITVNVANAYYRTEGTPGGDDDEPGESGGSIRTVGVNTRTLHPYQKYNFFIHYIRKDGSYTLGFPVSAEFKSYKFDNSNPNATVLIPTVSASKPDGDYVGYFISYEDVESTVDCIYITGIETVDSNKQISFTNAKYLFDIDNVRGSKLFINDVEYSLVAGSIKYIENRLTYNHIKAILENSTSLVIDESNKVAYYIKNAENIYNNKAKTLYRLTKNIYQWDTKVSDSDYLPAFYTTQVIIKYTNFDNTDASKEVIIDPANSFVTGFDFVHDDSRTTYNVVIGIIPMYSNYPMQAMNIKEDFQQAAVSLNYKEASTYAEHPKVRINTVVSPDKLHDLLELKACYKAKPSKSYINFNVDNIYKFDKTIYRSSVISDESLKNNFREFTPNNYKNILENKGKIVNIVGIGLYLIVHTEQSIFVFDRNPKLTVKSQLDIPDAFSIDYQDLMPSNEGFGGLRDKEEAIITKNGYIWFDSINKIIFNFENGKITIISQDINNFLKYLNIVKVRFAEDIIYNRLIICVYAITKDTYGSEFITTVTLSYNFNTKSFISIHDYKFTHNFRTSKVSYVFDEELDRQTLYEFDNTVKVDYKNLVTAENNFFPYYTVESGDPENVTAKSYIDIIFNNEYFNIKAIESIRYLLSTIKDNTNIYNITEEQLNRHFSGDKLKVYSDETDTGELDITVDDTKINKLNDYKHPYFNKGYWNFNYFRNKITQNLGSDNESLIYGKYIIVRFIFNNNNNIKLDGVDINTFNY